MIVTLLSWFIIFGCSIALGYTFIQLFFKDTFSSTCVTKVDVYFVTGLMVLTVFAQTFSIFGGVGRTAFLCVFVVSIGLGVMWTVGAVRKRWSFRLIHVESWKLCAAVALAAFVLFFTMKSPEFVDTYLYHIQAMKWIEEYGVVPGLGNLHCRFAYNSAFLALQALFSFSWMGEPLHSMNGCIFSFFVVYCVVTNNFFSENKRTVTDALKLVVIPYVLLNRRTIPSASTDILSMLLVLYVTIKWSECICLEKEQEKMTDAYALWCLLAVFAVTVKLSSASIIMLVVFPAYYLLKNRDWKNIIKYIALGVVIILPWLVRNVLISGYLIYPYSGIDLFSVDWKMPAALLEYDKGLIVAFGRETREISTLQYPIWRWLPIWFQGQMFRYKLLIVGGFIASLAIAVYLCMKLFELCKYKKSFSAATNGKEKSVQINRLLLLVSMLVGELFWLFSAPLVRYGMVYLMIPMAVIAYYLESKWGKKWNRGVALLATVGLAFICMYKSDDFRLVMPQGYWDIKMDIMDLKGIEVFYAADGSRLSDYREFPAIPQPELLGNVAPRGTDLADGFYSMEEK